MNERGLLAAADAVFDAERALRRAAETVEELGDVAASSLRVLDDAASDAFYAHQEERRDFYLESAGDHLLGLRHRSEVMTELGEDLTRHLGVAGTAIERADDEIDRAGEFKGHDAEVRALRSQLEVLGEVVALARPVASQITRHAQHAAESSTRADVLSLLDTRVHEAGKEVARADEDVSMMRTVVDSAQSRARSSAALAGSLSYAATHPTAPEPAPAQVPSPRDAGHSGIAI